MLVDYVLLGNSQDTYCTFGDEDHYKCLVESMKITLLYLRSSNKNGMLFVGIRLKMKGLISWTKMEVISQRFTGPEHMYQKMDAIC